MRTIEIKLPAFHVRTFEEYANHFCLPVGWLMQSELYSQFTLFMDDPFRWLEYLDKPLPTASSVELVTVRLSYSPVTFDFLEKLAGLLRRPLVELAARLLECDAAMLEGFMSEAMEGKGMDAAAEIDEWADRAMKFQRRARRNLSPPLCGHGFDCWDTFNIERPVSPRRSVTASNKG